MKKNKFEDFVTIKKAGYNPVTCLGYNNNSLCGAYATHNLPMPEGIPDMPMCKKHFDEASEFWTLEDVEALNETIRKAREDGAS